MRIIFSAVPFDRGKSGVSVYCSHLIEALSAEGHDLTLILEKEAVRFFQKHKKIVLPSFCSVPLFSMLYHFLVLPRRIRPEDYDFCILGAANRRVFRRCPVFTAAVVHDLSQYHVRNKYDPFRMIFLKKLIPRYVRRAHCIAAVSSATADDLKRFWHIPPEKIKVIYNGLSIPAEETSPPPDVRGIYGLSRPYVLCISRLEHPGKNHVNLIRAFNSLPEGLLRKYDLVLAGAPWNGAERIYREARDSRRGARIHFPGFVPAEHLPELYRNAACYIFPSFFEGFGLPLIEAMHYGIPCACSDGSSLKEIGQGAAMLFDPSDPAAIGACMETLLLSEKVRAGLIASGRKRAGDFTWKKAAESFDSLFRHLRRSGCGVFGVGFFNGTMNEALERVDDLIRDARRDGQCRFAAFLNAHCLNLVWNDPGLARILNSADAVFPDGSGIRLAGKLLGFPVRGNVNGTDMFPLLCGKPYTVYLFGAAPGVAEQAKNRAAALFPDVRFVGADHGWLNGPEEETAVIGRINRANPDILLVAMGMPKQEEWIFRHRGELRCGVAMAVGGLFDFVSGRIPRAPSRMRRAGLEWLFRLSREPRRLFVRYVIGNPLFVIRILIYRRKNREKL